MKRLLIPIAASLALAACQTPTVYQAAGPSRASVGFTETRIEPGRYRVTFRGGGGAPMEQVNDYALLRAAELTLRDGYDWFRVVGRYEESSGYGGGPQVSVGTGTSSWGHHSSVGFGVGTSFDLSGGPALTQSLEVVMGKGEKPPAPDAYDASAVVRSIAPRATPPPPPPRS